MDTSESGAPIYNHKTPQRDFEFALGDSENMERISEHIERHIGKIETVFHEVISDLVHIDIHIVKPTPERDYYTLVTSGMSDRAMQTPEAYSGYAYSELFLCLPPDWPMGQDDWKDEKHYWPIRALKFLARFPHVYKTWLWNHHTVPNGNPPAPFAENTQLCGVILLPSLLFTREFGELKIDAAKTIHFHGVIPLHADEMDLKLKKGSEALFEGFERHRVCELLSPGRPSSLAPAPKPDQTVRQAVPTCQICDGHMTDGACPACDEGEPERPLIDSDIINDSFSTCAANVQLNPIRYIRHEPGLRLIFFAGLFMVALTLASALPGWWILTGVFGVVCTLWIVLLAMLCRTSTTIYKNAALTPGLIISTSPLEMISLVNMAHSHGPDAYAVKRVALERLPCHEIAIGTTFPCVSSFKEGPHQTRWSDFSPEPLSWGTGKIDVIEARRKKLGEAAFRRLQTVHRLGKIPDKPNSLRWLDTQAPPPLPSSASATATPPPLPRG